MGATVVKEAMVTDGPFVTGSGAGSALKVKKKADCFLVKLNEIDLLKLFVIKILNFIEIY